MTTRTKGLNLREIGKRLRAYRFGASIDAASLAKRLGVSRAALYRIEEGQMIKIEVLERLAGVLQTSVASLLGAEVEYHASAVSYFLRMQQLEEEAHRIVAHFNPISYLLTSDAYSALMATMLEESVPADRRIRARALAEVREIWRIVEARKHTARRRRPTIVNLISVSAIERFIDIGLVGRLDLSKEVRAQRRTHALREVEHLAGLMENEPFGVQLGLIEDTLPNVTFQLFYIGNEVRVAVSPFKLGELPNVRIGVATVTASAEAIELYEEMFNNLWTRVLRGREGAHRLRALLKGPGKVVSLRADSGQSTAASAPHGRHHKSLA